MDNENKENIIDILNEENPKKIISDLTNKIILLEKSIEDLKAKNENLIKNNLKKNSLNLKSSIVGMKWNLASQLILKNAETDSNKLSEIIKEKDD